MGCVSVSASASDASSSNTTTTTTIPGKITCELVDLDGTHCVEPFVVAASVQGTAESSAVQVGVDSVQGLCEETNEKDRNIVHGTFLAP